MERNCRMCLAEDLKDSFQLFSHTLEDNLSVYDFYTNFTSISLRNQDERTKSKICLKCLKKLLTFYNDKCQAIANNEIMSGWNDDSFDNPDPECSSASNVKVEFETVNYVVTADPLIMDSISKQEPEEVYVSAILPANEIESVRPIRLARKAKVPMTQSVKKPETKKPLKKSLIQKSVPKKLIKSKASKSSEKPLNEKPVMKRKTTDRVERVKKTLSFLKTHGTIPKELENLSKSSKQVKCNYCSLLVRLSCFRKHVRRVHMKIKNFECEVCGKSFYGEYDYKFHKKIHSANRETFDCDQCDNKYLTSQSLVNHKRVDHENMGLFACDYPDCKYQCRELGIMNFHKRRVHLGIRLHNCDLCDKKYDYKSKLISHQRNVHNLKIDLPEKRIRIILEDKDDPVSDVQTTFKKSQKMDPKATIPCDICGKNMNRARLRYHLNRIHFNKKPVTCDYCGKTFLFKNEITAHLKKHVGIFDFPCDLCDLKFTIRHAMISHRRLQHFTECLISCTYPDCTTKFKNTGFMQDHIRKRHLRLTPHPCNQCGKGFINNSKLKEHVAVVHSLVRNFKCQVCPSTFKSSGGLAAHKLYHKENKHACDLCNKTYRTSTLLKAHKKVHSGIKDKACNLCPSKFFSNANLKRHMVNIHKLSGINV